MEILTFSQNWNNKLNCDCFTTIRVHNNRRYFLGAEFRIILKDKDEEKFISNAKIIDIGTSFLNKFKDYHYFLDTGYNKAEAISIFRNMYKNNPKVNVDRDLFNYILLKKIKDNAVTKEPVLKKEIKYIETCPQCQKVWTWQEIQSQSCTLCNYPEQNDNY